MCTICRSSPCPAACPNAPDPIVGVCAVCRQRIYASEPAVIVDGDTYHTECLDDLGTHGLLLRFEHDVREINTEEE